MLMRLTAYPAIRKIADKTRSFHPAWPDHHMPPTPHAPVHRPMLGILFILGAGTVFPVMNGLVQVLSPRYSTEQIIWARNVGHLALVLALFLPRFGAAVFHTHHPLIQATRSILMLASTSLFFSGVKHLVLAKAAAITFTSPFIVTVLAVPMLGERISLPRLMAVITGFLGVLVVIRPGSSVFQPASLLILGNSCCYALYQLFTRRVAGHDRPETSAIYSVLLGSVAMSLIVPFNWKTPDNVLDAVLLTSLGILGGLGHYFVAKAMTFAPANLVAPFSYWQMVGSIAFGYFVSDKLPDAFTWIGATIIIGAGLYIWFRELREREAGRGT